MVIEGGVNTQQPLARIISLHPDGAAYQNGQLKVGEIIQQVDGIELVGKRDKNNEITCQSSTPINIILFN